MMVGRLTDENEFLFPLVLRNEDGEELEVQAVLDTGFSGSLVPPGEVVRRLALRQDDVERVLLADGSMTRFSAHEVTVVWDDEDRTVTALGSGGDVLIGVQLLRGSVTLLEAIEGGDITIEAP